MANRSILQTLFARFHRPVVILDLETTGGHFIHDRITEIAFTRFDGSNIRTFRQLVRPGIPVPPFVAGLTGIRDDMLADAPAFGDIAAGLLSELRGCLLIAHNSRFDYTFLQNEFIRAGRHFAAPTLCTVKLSRRLYPQFFKHSLDSIIERFNIAVEHRHRAESDVRILEAFLIRAVQEHGTGRVADEIQKLICPAMPPAEWPATLQHALNQMSDNSGIVWLTDTAGNILSLETAEKAFSETLNHLRKQTPEQRSRIADIHFLPSDGPLHTVALAALKAEQHHLRPSESTSATVYYTVRFIEDERGFLQAKTVRQTNGFIQEPPYGLFLHKKAAKRALNEWAARHRLCPTLLDILPESYGSLPCPVHASGRHDCNCQTAEGITRQHETIRQHAAELPVAGFDHTREITVSETHPVTGSGRRWHIRRGMLQLPDGRFYFHHSLPPLYKQLFKSCRNNIEIIC